MGRPTGVGRSVATAFTERDNMDLAVLMFFFENKSHYRRASLLAIQPHLHSTFTLEQLEAHFEQQRSNVDAFARFEQSSVSPEEASAVEKQNDASRKAVMQVLKDNGWKDYSVGGKQQQQAIDAEVQTSDICKLKKQEQKRMQRRQRRQEAVEAAAQTSEGDESGLDMPTPERQKPQGKKDMGTPEKKGERAGRVAPDKTAAVRKSRRMSKGDLITQAQRKKDYAEFYRTYIAVEAKEVQIDIGAKEKTVRGYCEAWVEMERAELGRRYAEDIEEQLK